MNFNSVFQFGALTTRNGQVLRFEEIDTDKDGKISQQEFNFIQKELGLDTVEISGAEKRGEKQVTDEEYVYWAQEMQVKKAVDKMGKIIAKDFIGSNAGLAPKALDELREFMNDFLTEYKAGDEDLSSMAEKFKELLPEKYQEIKEDILGKDEQN